VRSKTGAILIFVTMATRALD